MRKRSKEEITVRPPGARATASPRTCRIAIRCRLVLGVAMRLLEWRKVDIIRDCEIFGNFVWEFYVRGITLRVSVQTILSLNH